MGAGGVSQIWRCVTAPPWPPPHFDLTTGTRALTTSRSGDSDDQASEHWCRAAAAAISAGTAPRETRASFLKTFQEKNYNNESYGICIEH
jgi:hypothetical protein